MSLEIEEYGVSTETKKDANEEKYSNLGDSSNKTWDAASTRYLFNYFKIFYPKVKRCEITNKIMWKLISDKLKKDNNISFSPQDIENRWRTLKQNHKKNNSRKPVRRKQILEVATEIDVVEEDDINLKLETDSKKLNLHSSPNSQQKDVNDESPIGQSKIFHKDVWDVRSTKLLIGYLKAYRPQVICGVINNKQMWQRISDKLKKDYDLNFSSDSCEDRTKILRNNYDNVVTSNLQKVFEYQKEMSELYEIEKNGINEVVIHPEDLTQEELQQATSKIMEPHSFHTYVTANNDSSKLTIVYDKSQMEAIEDTNYKMWDSDATKALISCFKFYNPLVGKTEVKNYKMMWRKISEKMINEFMLNYSSSACENRWKVLRRNYESVQTGKRKRSFEFFEEMDELCGKERKEKMARKLINRETKDEVAIPEPTETDSSMIFAEIKKDMQQYHMQKIKIKEEMLEHNRRRNVLIAERNSLLKKLIQSITVSFDRSGN